MKRKKTLLLLLSLCLIICSLNGCSKKYDAKSVTGFHFDTVVKITIYDTDMNLETKENLLDECLNLCDYYESLLSRTKENSDIYNINHANGKEANVSTETYQLIKEALQYHELSNGLIDPTIAVISDLWAFTSNTPKVPDAQKIDTALSLVDASQITLTESTNSYTIQLADPSMKLDLGFIAKGYIADKLKEYLMSQNVKSALIDLGGNLLTIGKKPDGTAFNIGIQKPFGVMNEPIITLSVNNSSVVTSGVYERYFEENGIKYHHLLNANTGYPENNNLLSVTILSQSSMEGDALSTTCYLLGLDEGMNLINKTDGVEAIFITTDYTLHYSDGLNMQ